MSRFDTHFDNGAGHPGNAPGKYACTVSQWLAQVHWLGKTRRPSERALTPIIMTAAATCWCVVRRVKSTGHRLCVFGVVYVSQVKSLESGEIPKRTEGGGSLEWVTGRIHAVMPRHRILLGHPDLTKPPGACDDDRGSGRGS